MYYAMTFTTRENNVGFPALMDVFDRGIPDHEGDLGRYYAAALQQIPRYFQIRVRLSEDHFKNLYAIFQAIRTRRSNNRWSDHDWKDQENKTDTDLYCGHLLKILLSVIPVIPIWGSSPLLNKRNLPLSRVFWMENLMVLSMFRITLF